MNIDIHQMIARFAQRCERTEEGAADVGFFGVKLRRELTATEINDLRTAIVAYPGEFGKCALFDGFEHSYLEIGGWIGDQGVALGLMGLGKILGFWKLLTPRTVLPKGIVDDDMERELIGRGMVTIVSPA